MEVGIQDQKPDIDKGGGCEVVVPRRRTYTSLGFIMTAVVLQGSFSGVQAILELFFKRLVFVCSKERAEEYGTIATNVFIALSLVTALTGGLLADYVVGNFHTQNISNMVAAVGVVMILVSSWQYTLDRPSCCTNNTYLCREFDRMTLPGRGIHIDPNVLVILILVGCALFAMGYGHTNAVQSVFVGDQFPEKQSLAKERSFSWYYWWTNVGNLINESGMPALRQSLGYVMALLVATGSFCAATLIFAIGAFWYVKHKPSKCSCKKKDDPETRRLLSSEADAKVTGRQLLQIAGVYVPLIAFWAIFFQQNSTWVLQGTQMNCYLGKLHVPPDLMPGVNDLLVLLIIPAVDYLAVPHLHSIGIRPKPLHKITCGMVCACLSFAFASLLQIYLKDVDNCRGEVSILWQVPQLLLISLAEVLVAVTGLEFAYSQSPPSLRNSVKSMWCITQALGTLLNAAIALINISLLYQFISYSGLMVVVILLFIAVNWRYKYL